MKSGFIAIIGRPSAGTSTLLNSLCGEKVSITSPVPQTTRNTVRGILNDDRGQLVFLDTPGYHDSDRKFNQYLKDIARSALEDAEAVLYVVDATRPPGKEEQQVVDLLTGAGLPLVLALNKTDLAPKHREEIRGLMRLNVDARAMIDVSALNGEGLDELKTALFAAVPEGDPLYPAEFYTDQEPEFRITEVIREKAFRLTSDEVPHALYVEIADLERRETDKGEQLWIRAFLTVERQSQVGIVVGRGGEKIKAIRQAAQKDLARLFPYRIHLDLRVKVNPKWRKKDYLLKGMFK